MENDKLDNDLLDSRLISIRDILNMGGYIPSLVFEQMNAAHDIPISDFIKTDDPAKNVFGYVIENMETIFQTTDGGTINVTVDRVASEIYAQAQMFDGDGEYCVRFANTLRNEVSFTPWEEYQTLDGLIKRLRAVTGTSKLRLSWLSDSEYPFEGDWYDHSNTYYEPDISEADYGSSDFA